MSKKIIISAVAICGLSISSLGMASYDPASSTQTIRIENNAGMTELEASSAAGAKYDNPKIMWYVSQGTANSAYSGHCIGVPIANKNIYTLNAYSQGSDFATPSVNILHAQSTPAVTSPKYGVPNCKTVNQITFVVSDQKSPFTFTDSATKTTTLQVTFTKPLKPYQIISLVPYIDGATNQPGTTALKAVLYTPTTITSSSDAKDKVQVFYAKPIKTHGAKIAVISSTNNIKPSVGNGNN
ncbi:MAG: hypothetical protein P1U63_04665 [Coxiellaceae bacterium]|nr:hypothetical protein [Coxiellaceae bacterium]